MQHIQLLLCRWLSSKTRAASDLAFSRYYSAIAPDLLNILRRKLRGNSAIDANDALQELVLKHLKHLKDVRPDHANRVIDISTDLKQLSKKHLIVSLNVMRWSNQVHQWVSRAINVHHCIAPVAMKVSPATTAKHTDEEDITKLDTELLAITNEYNQIQKDGIQLFLQVQQSETTLALDKNDQFTPIPEQIDLAPQTATLSDQYPDVFELLTLIAEVIDLLPSIRLPSLPLLRRMAKTTAIDAHRASHSQDVPLDVCDFEGDESRSLLDSIDIKEKLAPLFDLQNPYDQAIDQIHLDCRRLLEQPARQAEQDISNATSKQESARATQRLKKCTEKFYRNWSIFQLMLEDTSEVDIATALNTTRDVVRASKAEIKHLLHAYAYPESRLPEPVE